MKYYSKSGVGIYTDYRENIIVDADHPILKWKASKRNEKLPDGSPYIASQHSEDALSWNVFRSLQLASRLRLLTDRLPIQVDIEKLYFWQHDVERWSQEIAPEIQDVLNEIEPWGKNGRRQQTESDVILRGKHHIVMIESKLGKPNEMVKAWARGGSPSRPMRSDYLKFIQKLSADLFSDSFDFQRDGRRFYQLFRNYLLGEALSQRWGTHFSLLAIVNSLNRNLEGRKHEEEFRSFQTLLVEPANTFLMTWQQLCEVLPADPKLLQLRQWLWSHPLLGLSSPAKL